MAIELVIEEQEQVSSLCDEFESIPDDSMVVNVKLNFEILDEDLDNSLRELPFLDIKNYVKELAGSILYSTTGVHVNGENKKPHIHYHFITPVFYPPSNPSQHRKRWAKKVEASLAFLDCSFKFQKLDLSKPKYSVLSYPLKEGLIVKHSKNIWYVCDEKPMTKKQIDFLTDVAESIYQGQLALKQRQDKCEERKKVALTSLYNLCLENKSCFTTYKNMMIWLDSNFIATLELDDYPDPRIYKTNCQKIAVKLGILKYSEIV